MTRAAVAAVARAWLRDRGLRLTDGIDALRCDAEEAALRDLAETLVDRDPAWDEAVTAELPAPASELGQIDAAVQQFGKAESVVPGHVPALEGWRNAALRGQLWVDVAEAATREAKAEGLAPRGCAPCVAKNPPPRRRPGATGTSRKNRWTRANRP